jgi:hypothetical protein
MEIASIIRCAPSQQFMSRRAAVFVLAQGGSPGTTLSTQNSLHFFAMRHPPTTWVQILKSKSLGIPAGAPHLPVFGRCGFAPVGVREADLHAPQILT